MVATFIDVERLFSHGCLLLSHVCSWLSIQSTHALLCLGIWSKLNLVEDKDVKRVMELPEDMEHEELEGWGH